MKTSSYKRRTIEERLAILYDPRQSQFAGDRIRELIRRYRGRIPAREYHLSEKDVILITYGDQLRHTGEAPLATLKRFLDTHLRDVINSVHILPFYPYSSDDGFSVVNYSEVDPHMGSWREIEALSEHFRLMFDGVINHVSQYSDWFKAYLAGDPAFKDFFIDLDPSTDLGAVVRPRVSPLLHEYHDSEGKIHNIWTTFSQDQVDLNYKSVDVLIAVLDALFYYIEKGATLIRLDAIAFIWKEIGTSCVHLEQTHELIQLMRDVLHEVDPSVIIITETNVPHDENISYFGSGEDEAQMVYNFALPPLLVHSVLLGNTEKLTAWAKTLRLPSDKVCFFNFTASHDGVGVRAVDGILSDEEVENLVATTIDHGGLVSYRSSGNGEQRPYELNCSYINILTHPDADNTLRIRRMLLTQAVVLAMPGIPGIYFHSLVGASNDHQGVKLSGINRSINREKFNVDQLEASLNDQTSLGSAVFNAYKRLLSIRITERAFNPFGPFVFLYLHRSLFCVHHESSDLHDHILTVHNFSDSDVSFDLPDYFHPGAVDLVTNRPIDQLHTTIAPYAVLWIKGDIDTERFFERAGKMRTHEPVKP